jgi:rSAM/selenodomain-associated transferase 1
MSGALIVFAREPRPGTVKTRLAARLGTEAATEVYAKLLVRALRLAEESQFPQRYLFAAEPSQIEYFEHRLDAAYWRVRAQCGGDIGQRMHDAFETVLQQHDFAVLIGSDVADCTVADLDHGRAALARTPATVVIGPSVDGGYWLIGLAETHQSIFDDIPWSTASVLELTQARMTILDLDVVTLSARHDVDEIDDLRYLEFDVA